ncbi:MAG: hypothetical protein ABEJ78_09335 [Haloferacaceae archaeon]
MGTARANAERGATPERMDLYVQVNHGSNVAPLSAVERRVC